MIATRRWAVPLVLLVAMTSACGGDDGEKASGGTTTEADDEQTTTTAKPTTTTITPTTAPPTTAPPTTAVPQTAPPTTIATTTTEEDPNENVRITMCYTTRYDSIAQVTVSHQGSKTYDFDVTVRFYNTAGGATIGTRVASLRNVSRGVTASTNVSVYGNPPPSLGCVVDKVQRRLH
ncbi:MAG: hypothetical protein ACOYXM_16150 [Actinomycetota bacterium]